MKSKKPILVTGSHRSGTTWVGKILASSKGVGYIHEPFNLNHRVGICSAKFPYWFMHINEENENLYYNALKNCLSFRYNLLGEIRTIRTPKDLGRMLKTYKNFTINRMKNNRPIMKDPIAFFSAEWLANEFDMDVIVLIRHPAAFAGSLKKLNWEFRFSDLLNQPVLIEDHLSQFKTEVKGFTKKKADIIDQAILLWRIIYYQAFKYRKRHSNWIFLRHEDISRNPLEHFQPVFEILDLNFSKHVKKVIHNYSNSSNPRDVAIKKAMSLKRDSRAVIWNWKDKLTESEIKHIKNRTEDISKYFYSNSDWE